MIPQTAAILETGFGAWNPVIWLAVFLLALLITLLLRRPGRNDFKANSTQAKPFMSGNEVPDISRHIKAGNLYWGYLEALKGFYSKLIPLHTGISTDYVLWFLGVLSVVLAIGIIA